MASSSRVPVSVVIPAYNRAELTRQAVKSVLEQTYPADEILVIDDGSSDNTGAVIGPMPPPVRYVRQDNAGVSLARNHGLRLARNDWVALLDCDDRWLPGKLALQMEALAAEPDAVLVFGGILQNLPGGRQEPYIPDHPRQIWPSLRYRNPIPASTVLARRQLMLELGGFTPGVSGVEDWDMWVRMRRRGPFAAVAEPLAVYELTEGSLSGDPDRMLAHTAKIMDNTLLDGLSGWRRSLWRRRIWSAELYRSYLTMRDRESAAAGARYLWRSLGHWPSPLFLPKRWYSALRLVAKAA